ncbi:MAG TPA: hypothetical protein DHW02_05045 [Ktedonobacter sp.]|nr:hypothetical protein [Ktedonobacter sp.]
MAPTPVSTIGDIPQQHATVTPTEKTTSIPEPTVSTTVVPQQGTLSNCTTNSDREKQHLHICGSNFIAGDNIVFTLVDSKGRPMKGIGPVQVQSDGTFSQNIFIRSCKDVPFGISVRGASIKYRGVLATVSNIQYGNCQVGVSINQMRSNR